MENLIMTKTKKYIKRPQEFEVVQYTGKNGKEICDWSKGKIIEQPDEGHPEYIYLRILKNNLSALINYYIIKVEGEFSCCSPELFLKTYQLLK